MQKVNSGPSSARLEYERLCSELKEIGRDVKDISKSKVSSNKLKDFVQKSKERMWVEKRLELLVRDHIELVAGDLDKERKEINKIFRHEANNWPLPFVVRRALPTKQIDHRQLVPDSVTKTDVIIFNDWIKDIGYTREDLPIYSKKVTELGVGVAIAEVIGYAIAASGVWGLGIGMAIMTVTTVFFGIPLAIETTLVHLYRRRFKVIHGGIEIKSHD